MDTFVIHGGKPLRGTVRINGSKNASLPQIAAGLLTDQPVTLDDVPDLSDIRNMADLLAAMALLSLAWLAKRNPLSLGPTD